MKNMYLNQVLSHIFHVTLPDKNIVGSIIQFVWNLMGVVDGKLKLYKVRRPPAFNCIDPDCDPLCGD
jgi:hypothetical protein